MTKIEEEKKDVRTWCLELGHNVHNLLKRFVDLAMAEDQYLSKLSMKNGLKKVSTQIGISLSAISRSPESLDVKKCGIDFRLSAKVASASSCITAGQKIQHFIKNGSK